METKLVPADHIVDYKMHQLVEQLQQRVVVVSTVRNLFGLSIFFMENKNAGHCFCRRFCDAGCRSHVLALRRRCRARCCCYRTSVAVPQ